MSSITRDGIPVEQTAVRARTLALILAVALALRLLYTLSLDPMQPYTHDKGDSWWYLAAGYTLVTNQQTNDPIDPSQLAPAPLYLVFVGTLQGLLGRTAATVVAIRAIQALLSATTCYFAYRTALRVTGDRRAALLTAGVLAVAPVFILESGQVTTETLYIFFLTVGISVYIDAVTRRETDGGLRGMVLAGALFGLATLTRAVLLLFPVGLAAHLFIALPPKQALRRAAVLLVVYALIVSTWTAYNLARWNRFVVGGDGIAAFLYIGASGWSGPNGTDARLAEDASAPAPDEATTPERQSAYVEAAGNVIARDIPGYIKRRVSELAGAYLQPHGTTFFPGESLRQLAVNWLRMDRTPGGLLEIVRGDAFWPKLLVYGFHYTALIGGVIGMWLYRHRWRTALPLIGFIAYTTLVHLALLALPRYIFPTEVFWWVFAAGALARLLWREAHSLTRTMSDTAES